MRSHLSAVAALGSLLACALLAAACLQSPTDAVPSAEQASELAGGAEPIGEAPEAMAPSAFYKASEFPFVVQVKGKGGARSSATSSIT